MKAPLYQLKIINILLLCGLVVPIFAQTITVDRFMGVNTLREDPVDKMKAVGFIREYHNWFLNEGNPSTVLTDYSPGYPNAVYRWNESYQDLTFTRFDSFYNEIYHSNDIIITPNFLGNIFQIVDPTRTTHSYDNHIVQEQIPIAPNANSLDPASYKAHASYLYHYAARYGHQTFSTEDFNNIIVPRTHPKETPKTGMGLIKYMESWNEQDKWWWRGSHPKTYFTPEEYMTMLSADYDGHNQTLGPEIGIKNADPNMKVVMGGLARSDLNYLRAMVQWAKDNRPVDADFGQLPFQVLNIHHYIGNNPDFLKSTTGISPEAGNLRDFFKTFTAYRDSLNAAFNVDLEIWLSEFGWDTYDEISTADPIVTAPPIGNNSSYEVQAQWIIRGYLETLAAGIDRTILYFLRDEQTPYAGLFTSCGLLENAANNYKPKNSWFYTYTMKNILTDMVYDTDMSPCSDTTCARIYRFIDPKGGNKRIYAIWSPTASDKKFNMEFNLEEATGGTLVNMELPSIWGNPSIITEENPTIEVSERPLFIIIDGDYFSPKTCEVNMEIKNQSCGTLNLHFDTPQNNDNYQLWYMTGNFEAADFSHRLATLVKDNLTANDTVLTITDLKANTNYTFFLFPEGVGKSQTSKICTITGSTLTSDTTCKIPINPEWIFDQYKNNINPNGLFDEQHLFDPVCKVDSFPKSLWGFNYDLNDSMNVSIDLQAYYYIDAFTIHDEGSRGFFSIQIADSPNGPWETVTDYLTIAFNRWITIANVLPSDKPVRYLRFIADKSDAAKVGELFICGRLSDYNPNILPGVALNGEVKNKTCNTMTLQWEAPLDNDLKEYKIIRNGVVIDTVTHINGTLNYMVANLSEATAYHFAIVTLDQANQESEDSLKLSGTTLGGFNLCKIPLNTSMIYDHSNSLARAQRLIDEQTSYDPLCNPYSVPNQLWGANYSSGAPEYVSFNLQNYYHINGIYFHDGGGLAGNVKIQYSESPNGPWITFIDTNTVKFNDWIVFNHPIPNNPIVRYLRIEASADDAVAIGELYICGSLSMEDNPDIRPGIGKNLAITNLSCTSITLEWDHPFDDDIKEYIISGGPTMITHPYSMGRQSLTINQLTEHTKYNFSIITVDTAMQTSTSALITSATTYSDGECDLVCNLSCPCAICIRNSWMTNLNTSIEFDKEKLADEQDKIPACNVSGATPQSFWSYNYAGGTPPAQVEIDLQEVYDISKCHLYFQGGSGSNNEFKVAYKTADNQWDTIIRHETNAVFGWKTFDTLNIKAQYIRVIQPDINSSIGEIGLCGSKIKNCEDSLNLNTPIMSADTFKAMHINSNATIDANIAVAFLAEGSITLNSDFHAKAGSSFLAKIESCSNANSFDSKIKYAKSVPIKKATTNEANLLIMPNPFRNETNIVYQLDQTAKVDLAIFDYTGKMIKRLKKEQMQAGRHQISFKAENFQEGFFLVRLQIADEIFLKKMVLIR